MKTSHLVVIGIKGSVVALDRVTGAQLWAVELFGSRFISGSGFVTVSLDGDSIVAACNGEVFYLDAATGHIRWHNPLKGYGLGLATIALAGGQDSSSVAAAENNQRDESAAAGSAVATTH